MRIFSSIKCFVFCAVPVLWLSGCKRDEPAPTEAPPLAETVLAPPPETVTFNEHIQPILSEYCYHCHGPDAGTREPKSEPLRLDTPDSAFAEREAGTPAIIKGDAAASLIVKLMRDPDPHVRMPPPEGHKTMSPEEISLIELWIEQGAEYEPHWAFAPIENPAVPATGENWSPHPVDRFVFEKLAANHLRPNAEEDPRRFHRRLVFDLTGLPPQPEETDAFLKAHAEDEEKAIAAEADRLLATTASAEHFTRHWLDAARYADTHGIHIDNYRAIWPYRDWVIRAFQRNMPWDRFTIEQIAGDLLPDRTLDQQVATGFNRCLATTGEGGAIAEEYEAIYAQDRVDTMSAIWLGLTAGCAACHDHKFDPVSTREFYSLTAFFRNNTMSALDGNDATHPPTVFVPHAEDRTRWNALAGEIEATEKSLATRKNDAADSYKSWLAHAEIEAPRSADSTLSLHLPLDTASGPLRGTVDGEDRVWAAELPRTDGPLGPAVSIHGEPVDLGDLASFSRNSQVSYGGFIRIEGRPTGAVIARMNPGRKFRGWDLYLQDGHPGAHVIDSWDKAANKIVAPAPLESGKWHHVMVVFDGRRSGHDSLSIYVDGVRQNAPANPNSVGGRIETNVPLRLGSRHGNDSKLNGPVALQDFRFYRRVLPAEEILTLAKSSRLREIIAIPENERTKEQTDTLFAHFIDHVDEASVALRVRLDTLKTEQAALRERGSDSLIFEEKKDSEPFAHVLTRGVYSDKGEKVGPDTPAILPAMPQDAPKNRLGLARWLVAPENPLPARVTMNRTWHYFFGTGIVETTEDFGVMGARPSHPQLLDWLASEFIRSGWDYRHMLKTIATSKTYRQSGAVTPEKLEADPANRLLSRGPRVRLDAEQIRDLALAASGLLAPDVGGPPVRPYQPSGIWEAVAMPQSNTRHYKQDTGSALHRRSLYTFWKRTAAPPTMEILNAPTREVFCVRRDRTNTPLQALALMNDPQFVEASRVLATHAIRHAESFDARLDFITARLISRTLTPEERTWVRETLDTALAHYRSDTEAAGKLVSAGDSPMPDDSPPPPELAAWTLVASQIFNLDETVTR